MGGSELRSGDIDFGQDQRVVDHRKKSAARALKHAPEFVVRLRDRHPFQNDLGDAKNSVERRAELVRNEAQELVLGTIENGQRAFASASSRVRAATASSNRSFCSSNARCRLVQFEMGFDAGVNFFELERLGYVIHRAGVESLYFVLGFAQSAEENDGDAGGVSMDLRRSHTS